MNLFHARDVVPVGEAADSNRVRWKNATYSRHVDAMAELPLVVPSPITGAGQQGRVPEQRDASGAPAVHAPRPIESRTKSGELCIA